MTLYAIYCIQRKDNNNLSFPRMNQEGRNESMTNTQTPVPKTID